MPFSTAARALNSPPEHTQGISQCALVKRRGCSVVDGLAGDTARWRVLPKTDDTKEAIWLFEMVEREIWLARRAQTL